MSLVGSIKRRAMLRDRREQARKTAQVAKAFSPSAPINQASLFAGRMEQVAEVITAVGQRGQHAMLYGERGVGKTSLANVLTHFLSDLGGNLPTSIRVNCDETVTFSSLWHQIAKEISLVSSRERAGFSADKEDESFSLDSLLPEEVTPSDVRHLFQQVPMSTIIIIDEMDRLKHRKTTTLLADTAKTLSDHSVDVTLIFVGVADSVDELIVEHNSIERALVQTRMQRMSNEELFEIIDTGLSQVEMDIDKDARRRIVDLSQGLPHFTHLLGLHAARRAVRLERTNIVREDVQNAIEQAVEKAQHSIVSVYTEATNSPRSTLFPQVLLACAIARKDQLGYFSATDVRGPMTNIMGKHYDIPAFSRHLNLFCESERGPVLQKTGQQKRIRYRFINPMMEPFAIMNGLANELIHEDTLSKD